VIWKQAVPVMTFEKAIVVVLPFMNVVVIVSNSEAGRVKSVHTRTG
jgi:hypothetical protein